MYSMLNAQMLQARHADRTQETILGPHRRELRELRAHAPRRRRQLRRLAAVTAVFVLIGGASDALAATSTRAASGTRAATNTRFESSWRSATTHVGHNAGTSRSSVDTWRFYRGA